LELGVCENSLFGRFPASIPCDHFALAGYNGANGQLTCLFGVARFLNSEPHILVISVQNRLVAALTALHRACE
jgi:hypothetical protein